MPRYGKIRVKKKQPIQREGTAMDVAMERASMHHLFGPEQSKFKKRELKAEKGIGILELIGKELVEKV